MNHNLPCNTCKDGPCRKKRACSLSIPLFLYAAWRNPTGLLEAMYSVGFSFHQKTDSFKMKAAKEAEV